MTIRVCFWATTFQSDVQALACYLAEQPGFDVTVVMERPELYEREPVQHLLPFRGRLLDRNARATRRDLASEGYDVLVVDNHLPGYRIAPRLHVLWHGFGWRIDDLTTMKKELKSHVGDVSKDNPRFIWQAFGDWDRRYRVDHSGISENNVVALGSPYSDLLLPGSDVHRRFRKTDVQHAYSIDLSKRTVLLGLTWHHGGAFGHWGEEPVLLDRLCEHADRLGANVLVRMHDRQRYEPQALRNFEALAQGRAGVQLKFKSDSPDSLVDMLVSDAVVSNYSSLLNAFYYTSRPTLHIDPDLPSGLAAPFRKYQRGKVKQIKVDDPTATWKLGKDQVGGIRARSFDELLAGLELALTEPECCAELAADFCTRYIAPLGGVRERTVELLRHWVATTPSV